jgi:hypothetical protein
MAVQLMKNKEKSRLTLLLDNILAIPCLQQIKSVKVAVIIICACLTACNPINKSDALSKLSFEEERIKSFNNKLGIIKDELPENYMILQSNFLIKYATDKKQEIQYKVDVVLRTINSIKESINDHNSKIKEYRKDLSGLMCHQDDYTKYACKFINFIRKDVVRIKIENIQNMIYSDELKINELNQDLYDSTDEYERYSSEIRSIEKIYEKESIIIDSYENYKKILIEIEDSKRKHLYYRKILICLDSFWCSLHLSGKN